MTRVPVEMLTCADMRGYHLLRTYGPLAVSEIPLYFDLLRDVFDRWFKAVGIVGPAVYADYRGNRTLLKAVEEKFTEMLDEDDPVKAWKVRKQLDDLLDELERVVMEMAQAFRAPKGIREFYYNLSSRLHATYEYIIGGDE